MRTLSFWLGCLFLILSSPSAHAVPDYFDLLIPMDSRIVEGMVIMGGTGSVATLGYDCLGRATAIRLYRGPDRNQVCFAVPGADTATTPFTRACKEAQGKIKWGTIIYRGSRGNSSYEQLLCDRPLENKFPATDCTRQTGKLLVLED